MKEPLVFYCQITYADEYENTKKCVDLVAPYVDYVILVVEKQRPFTDEQKRNLLRHGNVILLEREYKDNHPEFRNYYLEEAKKIAREKNAIDRTWILVSDSDEFFNEQLLKDIYKIVKWMEENNYDIASINCRERFEVHEWMDNLDFLKEAPWKARESDFYKNLLFKLYPDLKYIGVGISKNVHETFNRQHWRGVRLPKDKYWYEHVKSTVKIWRNAARNFFCFHPDQLILTSEGIKRISEVKEGDYVWDGKDFVRVLKVYVRQYSGKLLKIKPQGSLPLLVTPEHPFLVAEVAWVRNRRRVLGFKWKEARELKPFILKRLDKSRRRGEYLVFPKFKVFRPVEKLEVWRYYRRPGRAKCKYFKTPMEVLSAYRNYPCVKPILYLTLTPEISRLLGYYCAEGAGSSCVHLYFGVEPDLVNDVTEIVTNSSDISYAPKVHLRNDDSMTVTFGGTPLVRLFKTLFGNRARIKRVPMEIMLSNAEIVREFLSGYIYGDGYEKIGKSGKEIKRFTTSSKVLALGIQLLFSKLDLFCSIRERKRRKRGKIGDRIIHSSEYRYDGTVYLLQNRTKFLEDEHAFYVPILAIEEVEYDGLVYNLQTESEKYVAGNILVHNCGGGGDNMGPLNPYWKPFRELCSKYGINTWKDFEEALEKGLPEEIEKKLEDFLQVPPTDYGTEMRQTAKYYYFLHPDKITPEILEKIKNPPKMTPEIEAENAVRAAYFQIFGRHPDRPGLEYWKWMILEGRVRPEDLPRIFMESEEYKRLQMSKGELVRVEVPVDVRVQVTEDMFEKALMQSDLWWKRIKPALDIGRFVIDNLGSSFVEWFYRERELGDLTIKKFAEELRKLCK